MKIYFCQTKNYSKSVNWSRATIKWNAHKFVHIKSLRALSLSPVRLYDELLGVQLSHNWRSSGAYGIKRLVLHAIPLISMIRFECRKKRLFMKHKRTRKYLMNLWPATTSQNHHLEDMMKLSNMILLSQKRGSSLELSCAQSTIFPALNGRLFKGLVKYGISITFRNDLWLCSLRKPVFRKWKFLRQKQKLKRNFYFLYLKLERNERLLK